MNKKSVSHWDHIPPESSVLREPEATYMIDKVRDGLPFAEFHAMQELLGVTEERLGASLGMPRATLHRREKTDTLDSAASDRLVSHAVAALGGVEEKGRSVKHFTFSSHWHHDKSVVAPYLPSAAGGRKSFLRNPAFLALHFHSQPPSSFAQSISPADAAAVQL